MEFAPLNKWIPLDEGPLVIAGPCSAESEFQVLETARQIATIPQVKVFRAGIWKPRSRPGSFEGIGKIGLSWLNKVKSETGLLTTVEVAKPIHVQEAVEAGIDILWIGARTVVNPFSIQELSESLSGIDIPVMLKNPLNPDIKLWIGAIERLLKTGHTKLAAIHRGFSQFEKSPYRYPPHWEIPIELMRIMPGLPVICDPSHITGNANMVPHIAQQALDLEMQGLMIETHFDPLHALTDAHQQLSPSSLKTLVENLVIRSPKGTFEFERSLMELRHDIDQIDDEIIQLLAKRMDIAKEMGRYKSTHNITILQLRRWKELFADRMLKGQEKGLDNYFLSNLLRLIHEQSIQIQTNVMNEKKDEPNDDPNTKK
ncbi:MAG: chorismate mutase [Lentimicrobiaceae bacterium]